MRLKAGPDMAVPVERSVRIMLALLLAILSLHAVGAVADMRAAIGNPLELDYGEGIVWQQAVLIPGPRMYALRDGLPFIVFHYPPVYYLLVRVAAVWMPDMLAAGRLVSGVSAVLMAGLAACLVLATTRRAAGASGMARIALAAAAGLLLLDLDGVRVWACVMRVDMPGYVFTLAGLFVAARADGRFWGVAAALALCLAAVLTKQTLLPAGVAVVLVGLLRRPWPTLAAAALVGTLGVALVAGLQWFTGGGFLANILGGNLNRMAWDQVVSVLGKVASDVPPMLAMVVAAAWLGWTLVREIAARRQGRGWALTFRTAEPLLARRALVLVHFGLSGVMLVAIAKVGSNFNYLIDWLTSGAVLIGVALIDLQGRIGAPARRGLIGALAALSLMVAIEPLRNFADRPDPREAAAKAAIVERIARTTKPVASEEMTLLMRAGKEVWFEPSIVTELASVGRWDETGLVEMFRTGGFAFVLTSDGGRDPTDRRTPAVNAAMQAAYPRLSQVTSRLWLREPR